MTRAGLAMAFVLGLTLLQVTTFAAGEAIKAGEFSFQTTGDFPEGQKTELHSAFRYAIHACIEYEWAKHNIRTVDFVFGKGAPPVFKDVTDANFRLIESKDFSPSAKLARSAIDRYYRFVIRFAAKPTWDDGTAIEGVTEQHVGIVYVALDAHGKVLGVFNVASWEDSNFIDGRDKPPHNLTEAICS